VVAVTDGDNIIAAQKITQQLGLTVEIYIVQILMAQ